jgi:hypothetical protein
VEKLVITQSNRKNIVGILDDDFCRKSSYGAVWNRVIEILADSYRIHVE